MKFMKDWNPHIKTTVWLAVIVLTFAAVVFLSVITDGIFLGVLMGLGVIAFIYAMIYSALTDEW